MALTRKLSLLAAACTATVLASSSNAPSPRHVFVNPSFGSDAALGATPATPLRTLAAAKKRVRRLLADTQADVVVSAAGWGGARRGAGGAGYWLGPFYFYCFM